MANYKSAKNKNQTNLQKQKTKTFFLQTQNEKKVTGREETNQQFPPKCNHSEADLQVCVCVLKVILFWAAGGFYFSEVT